MGPRSFIKGVRMRHRRDIVFSGGKVNKVKAAMRLYRECADCRALQKQASSEGRAL